MDINELLVHMVTRQASDLYIKTESPPMLRIAGQLSPIGDNALAPEEVEELELKAFAGFVTLCQSASFLARGRDE